MSKSSLFCFNWLVIIFTMCITSHSLPFLNFSTCFTNCTCYGTKITIRCKSVELKSIPIGGNFSAFDVIQIYMQYNDISNISQSQISYYENVQNIDLSYNLIKTISSTAFQLSQELRTINLSYNLISKINENTFSNLYNLKELILSYNALTSFSCSFLPSLNNLALDNNELMSLSDGWLYHVGTSATPTTIKLNNNDLYDFDYTKLLEYKNYVGKLEIGSNNIPTFTIHVTNSSEDWLTELDLGNNYVYSIAKVLPAELRNLTTLDLSNNNIEIIPAGAFRNTPNLKVLNLYRNSISGIHFQAFTDLQYIQTINLGFNSIIELKSGTFQNLSNLITIRLDTNHIETIQPETFDRINSSRSLTVSMDTNSMTQISQYSLGYIAKINKLDLNNNKITDIHPQAFQKLQSIGKIMLENNNIVKLYSGTFANLKQLTTIQLPSNEIDTIERNLFQSNYKAKSLNLNYNNLEVLNASLFLGLDNLKTLEMSANHLWFIHEDAFDELTNLESLDLTSNLINALPKKAFVKLTRLETLKLTGNKIISIGLHSLSGLQSLKSLYINRNELTDIEPGSFQNLTELGILKLQNNNLKNIKQSQFKGLNKLLQLHLFSNGMMTIEDRSFEDLNNLYEIDLSTNLLRNLSEETFLGLNQVHILSLYGCKISHISEEAFLSVKAVTNLNLDENLLTNLTRKHFQGLSKLKHLNVRSNQISKLSDGLLSNVSSLMSAKFDGNPLKSLPKLKSLLSGDSKDLDLGLSKTGTVNVNWNVSISQSNFTKIDLSSNSIENINSFEVRNIKSLNLSDNVISKFSRIPLANITSLSELDLSKNRINSMTSQFAKQFQSLPNLKVLNLSSNRMRSINDNVFTLANYSLTTLILQENSLENINFILGLSTVKALNLRKNNIKVIPVAEFQAMSAIENLDLGQNRIKSISNNVFLNATRLLTLDLSENVNLNLHNNSFKGLSALTTLILEDCEIIITKDIFQNHLSKLAVLNLNGNKLSYIDSIFATLKQLKELYLERNSIASISDDGFRSLRYLTKLSLNSNRLQKLDCLPLKSNIFLTTWHVARNNFSKIMSNCWPTFGRLKSFDFSYNGLSHYQSVIAEDILTNTMKVEEVYLAGNGIEDISQLVVNLLRFRLRSIDFSYNNLTKMVIRQKIQSLRSRNLFNCLLDGVSNEQIHQESVCVFNYYKFNFAGNNLQEFPEAFRNLRNTIQSLTFNNNNITTMDSSDIFRSHDYRLNNLNMANNGLKTFSNKYTLAFSGLKTVNMSNNSLVDICKTEFQYLFPGVTNLYLDRNGIRNLITDCFSNLRTLAVLSLKDNSLTFITSDSFAGAIALQTVLSTRSYLCCMVPAKVTTCQPYEQKGSFSTCHNLLSHVSLRLFIWIVGCFAFIGNILVLALHKFESKSHGNNVPRILISNLAIADFVMSIYLLIIAIADGYYTGRFAQLSESWLSSGYCAFACFLCCVSSLMSVFMMLLISLDRWFCIVHPFSRHRFNAKAAIATVCTLWIFCSIFVGVPAMSSINASAENRLYGYSSICMASNLTNSTFANWLVAFIAVTICCWIITALLYIQIFLTVQQSHKNVAKSNTANDKAMAIRLLLILVTDLISWLPFYIMTLLQLTYSEDVNIITLQFIIIFALPINSAVNPCLYTLTSPTFLRKIRSARINANITGTVPSAFTAKLRKTNVLSVTVDEKISNIND